LAKKLKLKAPINCTDCELFFSIKRKIRINKDNYKIWVCWCCKWAANMRWCSFCLRYF